MFISIPNGSFISFLRGSIYSFICLQNTKLFKFNITVNDLTMFRFHTERKVSTYGNLLEGGLFLEDKWSARLSLQLERRNPQHFIFILCTAILFELVQINSKIYRTKIKDLRVFIFRKPISSNSLSCWTNPRRKQLQLSICKSHSERRYDLFNDGILSQRRTEWRRKPV